MHLQVVGLEPVEHGPGDLAQRHFTDTGEREKDSYRNELAQITEGQVAGYISTDTPAVHLLTAVLAVIGGWAIASPALHQAVGEQADRGLRRAGVRQAVERPTAPSPG